MLLSYNDLVDGIRKEKSEKGKESKHSFKIPYIKAEFQVFPDIVHFKIGEDNFPEFHDADSEGRLRKITKDLAFGYILQAHPDVLGVSTARGGGELSSVSILRFL
jgi:hypothetical protein